jgi:hypothetical protein
VLPLPRPQGFTAVGGLDPALPGVIRRA